MRNQLNRAEMMNEALSQAGSGRIPDIDTDTSELASKVKGFWKRAYQALLSTHPYNFSTKRTQLTSIPTNPANPYNYRYEIPADAWVIWDLYSDAPNVFPTPQRAERFSQSYYVAPFLNGLQFESGGAEIVDGTIATDAAPMHMLYTKNTKIQVHDYGPYFVEEMINSMSMMLLKDKGTDTNLLGIHSRLNDKASRTNRTLSSQENNEARRVPRSHILGAVDNGLL